MNYLCEKNDVVSYIITRYENEYEKEISPIKLQKALYFIFAEVSAKTSLKTDENADVAYLFDAKFEAWPYGPVDKEVYKRFKYKSFAPNEELKIDENMLEYINELLNEIFKLSDFRLVDISHQDKEWRTKIKSPNINMSNQEIIKDYMHV